MKKYLGLLLALSLALGAFSACGEKGQTEVDDGLPVINLALRSGIYADVVRECVPQFEMQNQVHCNIVEFGVDELHLRIAQDADNGVGEFDLCMVDGSWMSEYTQNGVLADLTALGYCLDEDIIAATTKICYNDGELYLAPYYGNVTVLMYNKAILKKAGYEAENIQSLEDIFQICQAAQKDGNYGFMYRGDSENNYVVDFLPILSSFGGWVVDDNNIPTIDTYAFRQAMEFYMELTGTGKAESKNNLITAIANGAAAMAVGWPGWYTPDESSSADYCAFSGKAEKDSIAYNANIYGIWTIGIPENSRQKELACRLLEYLMSPEVQKSTVSCGGVPCRYSCLKDEEVLKEYPQYKEVCNALENGIYRPIMTEWASFYTILGEEMELMMEGKQSIEKGLSDAQDRLEKMMGKEE